MGDLGGRPVWLDPLVVAPQVLLSRMRSPPGVLE